MPALIPTDFTGHITWMGVVPDRDTPEIKTLPTETLQLTFAGNADEIHAGKTRPACSRVSSLYPEGTEIRNTRQLSIVSAEDLHEVAIALELEEIDPQWLGASLVVEGIPDFSHIPPSSRLQSENGTTLTIDMQNRPCQFPAMTIEAERPGHGKKFKPAAKGRRGVTAWVEREGVLKVGDSLRLHIPDQRGWRPV
ncbi:MAG: MOSC domain-containing protein [Boseongicola sp.]